MKFDDLKTLAYNGKIDVSGRDVFLSVSPTNSSLNLEGAKRGTFAVSAPPRTLTYTKIDVGSTGAWIPYRAQANVYGYLNDGDVWVASGPYSGCHFEIGVHNGKIYGAHLSREGPNDPNIAAWNNALPGKRVLYSNKISAFLPQNMIPKGTAVITLASVNVAAGTIGTITALSVVTPDAGSMTGRIMGVTKLYPTP